MTTKEWSTKMVNFKAPRSGVLMLGYGYMYISHIVKIHYFFKNLLLYSQAWIRQTKFIVMITKEGSTTKIVNLMTPETGVLVLGCVYISHIVQLHISLKIFFSTPKHRSDKLSI